MGKLWKWLFLGPPLSTERSVRKFDSEWVITLPDEPTDRFPGLFVTHFFWGIISIVGIIALISVFGNASSQSPHNPDASAAVIPIVGVMATAYILTLRISRERSCTQLVCSTAGITVQHRSSFFGWTRYQRRYTILLYSITRIDRKSNSIYLYDRDSKQICLLKCQDEETAVWVYQELTTILQHLCPSDIIQWRFHDEALTSSPRFMPDRFLPWMISETDDRFIIDFPRPSQTPLEASLREIRVSLWWAKISAGICGFCFLVIVAAASFGSLVESYPVESLQIVGIPFFIFGISIVATVIALGAASDEYKRLPIVTGQTQRIPSQIMVDSTGLRRTNVLDEIEFVPRSMIASLQLDVNACHGEDSSLYTYTVTIHLMEGNTVHLMDRLYDEHEPSRTIMESLIRRIEQHLQLPGRSPNSLAC